MNVRPEKISLLDRSIIGTLLFFASLLVGIQLAKAADSPPPHVATTTSPDPVISP